MFPIHRMTDGDRIDMSDMKEGIMMIDGIILGGIAVVVALAVIYMIKEKKKGTGCIGCSCSGCSRKCAHASEAEQEKE